MAQTKPQTDGHGDSMTNSVQWGRDDENKNAVTEMDTIKKLPNTEETVNMLKHYLETKRLTV